MTDVATAHPKADSAAALDFLGRFYPDGPWLLTSIEPERKGIATVTFGPASTRECLDWIGRFNGKRNIYFSVNPPTRPLTKKAEREDIKEVAYLHIDIDPRAGEDIDDERARCLGLLTDSLPQSVPPPTVVIFSGGGYQGFWRLREPIPINGDPAAYEDAKRYNQQLELLFGGDNCHNIDRIMRLPGTVNIPDARKRKKGRVETLAELVSFDDELVYPLDQFQAAQPVQIAGAIGELFGGAVVAPKSAQRLTDIDELDQWKVPPRLKVAVVQGHDPERPLAGDNSRSGWVYFVACGLARAGVPPEVTMGVLLDPDFGISESVREKRSPEKYAARQVERALAAAEARWATTDQHGTPTKSYQNTRAAILRLGLLCQYDEFHDRKYVTGVALKAGGELSDRACAAIRQLIIDNFGFDPGKDHVSDAVGCLCDETTFNPVVDYLDELRWDGQQRVDNWLTTYLGADDTPLNRAVGRLTLVAAVRRVRVPGCKFDFIPVLEGQQGSGKSTALRLLAGSGAFSDQEILHVEARAQQEATQGVWIYELGELAGLRRADVERVKAFASKTHDRARPAYGRHAVDQPRRCIFVGTTNQSQYLRDTTGNRRFWPVKTGAIDLETLARDRDQLWAEAARLEADGERLELDRDLYGAAAVEQEARREHDTWLDVLANVEGQPHGDEERVASVHLLSSVLHIPFSQQRPAEGQRLADCMKQLGWGEPKKMRIGGVSQRGYARSLRQRAKEPF